MPRRTLARTILTAGLVAGALDILDPIVFYWFRSHVPPIRILQSVDAGLIGKSAYAGGWQTAILGLALHFCIALAWAALFVFAARAIPALKRHAISSGLLYGLFVFAMMNFVILPHTHAAAPVPHLNAVYINAVCAIVFLIGLPIALINRRLA